MPKKSGPRGKNGLSKKLKVPAKVLTPEEIQDSFLQPDELTMFEMKFCEDFAIDLNMRQACIRAGYKGTPENASNYATEIMKKPHVRNYIRILRARQQRRLEITSDFVVLGLKEVALRCMQKTPVREFDPAFGMVQKTDEKGNDVWEFDSQGANKALELLGKHLGVFEKDNNQKRMVFNVALVKNENNG